ncbi:hypothetical protein [Pseudoruegeria sp. SK021]|uniref:hypothetical protein n=1 Tax=Pseudoruegeria sp. SK021 TaxID=1933035 RepID=UPI000A227A26|nr:hypothetical protein [Pseudoruegeria sp. SK021]OSP56820.1 hypothetical protein BV911_02460 [Pseudoruegeria sp. SK021]
MVKFTAIASAALIALSSASFAGSMAPTAPEAVVVAAPVDAGYGMGMSSTALWTAAALVVAGALIINSGSDDDDSSSSSSSSSSN